jgi:hypothetical protein
VALGALGELLDGLLGLFELVADAQARSVRLLTLGWSAVLVVGLAVWRWGPMLLDRTGGWVAIPLVAWAVFGLYLVSATIATVARAIERRRSRSRPAS